jgi:hypothetical protein
MLRKAVEWLGWAPWVCLLFYDKLVVWLGRLAVPWDTQDYILKPVRDQLWPRLQSFAPPMLTWETARWLLFFAVSVGLAWMHFGDRFTPRPWLATPPRRRRGRITDEERMALRAMREFIAGPLQSAEKGLEGFAVSSLAALRGKMPENEDLLALAERGLVHDERRRLADLARVVDLNNPEADLDSAKKELISYLKHYRNRVGDAHAFSSFSPEERERDNAYREWKEADRQAALRLRQLAEGRRMAELHGLLDEDRYAGPAYYPY